MTAEVLAEERFPVTTARDARELAREIDRGAALALVAAEGLDEAGVADIRDVLDKQPPWSEFPILLFPAEADEIEISPLDVFGPRAHVTLIDRPIRVATLLSAIRTALRSRRWQYELQSMLQELADSAQRERLHAERERVHAEHLASLAEASVAIASARSLEDVLTMLTEQARSILQASCAVTRVATKAAERGAAITTTSSCSGEIQTLFTERGEEFMANLRRPLNVPASDFSSSPLSLRLQQLGLIPLPHNAISMPLSLGDAVGDDQVQLGYIVLFDRLSGGDFTAVDASVLRQLAQMASVAVQKAHLYREAQEANRAKDDFLATLAHELRTPMTAILGWLQMLKAGDLKGADISAALSMIESSTKIQAHLIEDLLDVSRIIAGKLNIRPAAIELAPLLERVLATFRSSAEQVGVQLSAEIAAEPLGVWGDPIRLQQVLWNLLSNAIKFTPSGGSVKVSLRRQGSFAEIQVTDTGEGIAPEFLPQVFERFEQAERGLTTRSRSGLGLGLAIVRHLVQLHGGTVEASSHGVGKGATFTVSLPIRAVQPVEVIEPPPESLPELVGRRILVVDDDPDAREVLRVVLSRFGAEVTSVASVAEAVSILPQFDPDLIISDIAMPGEDGYALVRRLRELQPLLGRDIPTVALTGYGREEDQLRILSAGFRRYVQKPVPPGDLARVAAGLIGE